MRQTLRITVVVVYTTLALPGQGLFAQTIYQVDESFSTDMVFRSCSGGVANFYVRDDGEIIVGGGFENTYHAWATPFAIGHELISPNGERNTADWGGAGIRSNFMTDYDEDHLLVSSQFRPMLLRKDGTELLNQYFYPYAFSGNSWPFDLRFNRDCYVLEDKSVICAGSWATDSTDQSLWRHLYRFHPDGLLDTDFPAFEGEPNAPTLTRGTQIRRFSDGSWILSGSFMAVNGHHSPHLIKLTPDFEIDTTFVSPFGYYPNWAHQELHLLDSEDNLWIGGVHIELPSGELSPHNLYKVSSSGEIVSEFVPGAIEGIPYVQGVYWSYTTPRITEVTELNEGNRFVISGTFYKYNGSHAASITVVDGNGELQEGYFQNQGAIYDYCMFNQTQPPRVPAIHKVYELDDGSLLLGGEFSEFNTFDHDNNDEVVESHEHYSVVKLLKGTVGTADRDNQNVLKLYPNPARDRFQIELSDGMERLQTVELWDVQGRPVRAWPSTQNIYSTEGLPAGLYVVRVLGQQGSFSQKLILE